MIDMGANQIKTARKILGDGAFNEWLEMRGLGPTGEPDDSDTCRFWLLAMDQYSEDKIAINETNREFKKRRILDEYEYAARFGLDWPVKNA